MPDEKEPAANGASSGDSESSAEDKRFEQARDDYADSSESGAGAQLPEINFATFIFSLNSSVLLNLGMLADPTTGEKSLNLPMARQTIDIISMLEEKTRGNLTSEEEQMIKNILYELRMLYVKAAS